MANKDLFIRTLEKIEGMNANSDNATKPYWVSNRYAIGLKMEYDENSVNIEVEYVKRAWNFCELDEMRKTYEEVIKTIEYIEELAEALGFECVYTEW